MNSLFHIFCWESFHLKVHPTSLPERERRAVKSGTEDRNTCNASVSLHTRNCQTPASCKLLWPPTTVTDIPDNWCWHIHLFYSASDKWDLIPAFERWHPCSWKGFLWDQSWKGHIIRLTSVLCSLAHPGFLNFWVGFVMPKPASKSGSAHAKITFALTGL